jgi:hypothetical protein
MNDKSYKRSGTHSGANTLQRQGSGNSITDFVNKNKPDKDGNAHLRSPHMGGTTRDLASKKSNLITEKHTKVASSTMIIEDGGSSHNISMSGGFGPIKEENEYKETENGKTYTSNLLDTMTKKQKRPASTLTGKKHKSGTKKSRSPNRMPQTQKEYRMRLNEDLREFN